MPAQRWATNCLILNNPTKMMRVAYEIRQLPDQNGTPNFKVDMHVQRRVLVSTMTLLAFRHELLTHAFAFLADGACTADWRGHLSCCAAAQSRGRYKGMSQDRRSAWTTVCSDAGGAALSHCLQHCFVE